MLIILKPNWKQPIACFWKSYGKIFEIINKSRSLLAQNLLRSLGTEAETVGGAAVYFIGLLITERSITCAFDPNLSEWVSLVC